MFYRPLTALAVAVLLAGCGTSPATALRNAPTGARAATAANAPAVKGRDTVQQVTLPIGNEVIPSEADLAKLAATSPDELIDDAPVEPGVTAFKIGPTPPVGDLGNFGRVEDTLWRGARPTDKGLAQMKAMGLKSIVNFENDKKVVDHERAWASANGIKFYNIPMSVVTPPKAANIQQFLSLANNAANRPLYFHCMQGRDRTGTAAFCYRVAHDRWSYDKAYAEMKSFNFHTYLLGLRGFLVWYANDNKAPKG